jgi:hypothetical protein
MKFNGEITCGNARMNKLDVATHLYNFRPIFSIGRISGLVPRDSRRQRSPSFQPCIQCMLLMMLFLLLRLVLLLMLLKLILP